MFNGERLRVAPRLSPIRFLLELGWNSSAFCSVEQQVHEMLDQHPVLRERLLVTGIFALIILSGAVSVDFMLTNGFQWGADAAPAPAVHLAGAW